VVLVSLILIGLYVFTISSGGSLVNWIFLGICLLFPQNSNLFFCNCIVKLSSYHDVYISSAHGHHGHMPLPFPAMILFIWVFSFLQYWGLSSGLLAF
jgi:hypothetical protein